MPVSEFLKKLNNDDRIKALILTLPLFLNQNKFFGHTSTDHDSTDFHCPGFASCEIHIMLWKQDHTRPDVRSIHRRGDHETYTIQDVGASHYSNRFPVDFGLRRIRPPVWADDAG